MLGINQLVKWVTLLLAVLLMAGGLIYIGLHSNSKGRQEVVTTATVLQSVQAIGKLELVRYHLQQVLTKEVNDPTTFLGRPVFNQQSRVLLIVSGDVVGCIDLQKLDSAAIVLKDSILSLRLPPAEVCVYKIDHEHTQVYDASFSLADKFFNREAGILQGAYLEAERHLLQSAKEQGIEAATQQQARQLLQPLLLRLGIKQVKFLAP